MSSALRSTVIVPVLEASDAVDRWREQTCNDKPSIGVPAHITLIFPFVPARQLDQQIVGSLEQIVRETAPFEFELREAARFPMTLYLVPLPSAAFAQLTEAIVRQFPDYLPYGGAFDTIVPHLTVAHGDDPVLDEAEADVQHILPIKSIAREALLLEEVKADWGRWEVRARLPFAPGALA
jgi:2'-5' RNA ligase